MLSSVLYSTRIGRTIFLITGVTLLVYFTVMDIFLYFALQTHQLLQSEPGDGYSVFSPLSIKLLLSNYVEHYIYSPTSEYFNIFTGFSKVFYFITPNMITFTHLLMAILAGKMASSELLHRRRIAVILFEFRSWLDTLDGTVYRSHTADNIYTSHQNQLGYFVDVISDMLGGIFFCVGLWWYITKLMIPQNSEILPKKSLEKGQHNVAVERHTVAVKYSKKYLFLVVWKYGFLILISSVAWTLATQSYQDVFEVVLADEKKQILQLELLRSNITWFIFWLWRMLEGQSLLHVIVFVAYIDKVWEFINAVPLLGYMAFITLNILTYVHVHQVRTSLGL